MASTIFASQGIVLEIMRSTGHQLFWQCEWWSDFSAEQECVFLGGLTDFTFNSIRNMTTNKNYQSYIAPITMLKNMVYGESIKIKKPTEQDVKYMNKLIFEEISGKDSMTTTPSFITKLFHNVAKNVKTVKIAMHNMNVENFRGGVYGFSIFSDLFMISDTKSFNTTLMVKLFENMENFILFRQVPNYRTRKIGLW